MLRQWQKILERSYPIDTEHSINELRMTLQHYLVEALLQPGPQIVTG